MRFAIAFALTLSVAASLPAADASPAAGTLAFDRNAVKSPDPAAGKVVARALSEYIYTRSELPVDRLGIALRRLIVPRVFDAYAAQHGIGVSEEEVDELLGRVKLPGDGPAKDDERNVARSTILQWKVNASLFSAFGGRVVSQQGGPMEPVGAWEEFLESLEKTGAIEFADRAGREEFYKYYRNSELQVMPPSSVDFKTPWWKR